MKKSNFDKFPEVKIVGHQCTAGWNNIIDAFKNEISRKQQKKTVIAVECYHGVYTAEILTHIENEFPSAKLVWSSAAMLDAKQVDELVYPYVTDDPVFGYMAPLELKDFFAEQKIAALQNEINTAG